MVVMVMIGIVLAVGVATSMQLLAMDQDLRKAASDDDFTTQPTTVNTPSVVPTTTDTTCLAEGEGTMTAGNENLACCSGLTAVSCQSIGENNQLVSCGGGTICTKCGNGVCGIGENTFNCAVDCQQTTQTTTTVACAIKPSCVYDNPACTPTLLPNQSYCADADLDGDGDVDQQDYAELSRYFFKRTNASKHADITRDGVVDIYDYALMTKQWTGSR